MEIDKPIEANVFSYFLVAIVVGTGTFFTANHFIKGSDVTRALVIASDPGIIQFFSGSGVCGVLSLPASIELLRSSNICG